MTDFNSKNDGVGDFANAITGGALLRVFIPSLDRDGVAVPAKIAASVATKLARIAGGATVLPGVGFWGDPDGRIITEPVFVAESYLPDDLDAAAAAQLVDTCVHLAVHARQVAVGIAINQGRLYLVPGLAAGDEANARRSNGS